SHLEKALRGLRLAPSRRPELTAPTGLGRPPSRRGRALAATHSATTLEPWTVPGWFVPGGPGSARGSLAFAGDGRVPGYGRRSSSLRLRLCCWEWASPTAR